MRFALLVIGILLGSVMLMVGLVYLLRGRHRLGITGTTDIESAYINLLGAIYAIFISFMIFVVWSRFDNAANAVDAEANRVIDLFRVAGGLPSAANDQLHHDCRVYVASVIHDEWPAMRNREASSATWHIVDQMWQHLDMLNRNGTGDSTVRDHLQSALLDLSDQRRYRLFLAGETLPGVLWALLIFGGILTVGFAALFRLEPFSAHAFKVGVLTVIIAFFLVVIWELDNPFHGTVVVGSEAFRQTRVVFSQPD